MSKLLTFIAIVCLNICSTIYSKETSCSLLKLPHHCPKLKHPVCGLYDPKQIVCIRYPCGETFINACKACKDPRIISFIDGPCETVAPVTSAALVQKSTSLKRHHEKKFMCDSRIQCLCVRGAQFVCAHKNDGTTYYAPCGCRACANFDVKYYTEGLCPKDKKLAQYDFTICNVTDQPEICPLVYIGLCAVTQDGLKEVGNTCLGCRQDGVLAVYNGKCPNHHHRHLHK
jgi:hypothetical protein